MGKELRLAEKLETIIPGFSGYKKKELLREDDKLVRTKIARILRRAKDSIEEIFIDATERDDERTASKAEELSVRLGTLRDKVLYASYGYAGFFDRIKIKEDELKKLLEYDAQLVELAMKIREKAKELEETYEKGEKVELEELEDLLDGFSEKLSERENLVKG